MHLPSGYRGIWILVSALLALGVAFNACSPSPNGGKVAGRDSSRPTGSTGAAVEKNGRSDPASCGPCHEQQNRFWAYGAHSNVSCEVCHGVTGDHMQAKIRPRMPGNEHCLDCHSLIEDQAGPKMAVAKILEHHLRFVEEKHVLKVDRGKVNGRCVYCHEPHLGQ